MMLVYFLNKGIIPFILRQRATAVLRVLFLVIMETDKRQNPIFPALFCLESSPIPPKRGMQRQSYRSFVGQKRAIPEV